MRTCFAAAMLVVFLLPNALAAAESPASPAALQAMNDALAPSVVLVEYELQLYNGQPPPGHYESRCIRGERPLERSGWLVSPTQVVSSDPSVHPRFVKEIRVRFGEQRVKATVTAYGVSQVCRILDLAEPLKNAKPLAFGAAKDADYSVIVDEEQGAWRMAASPFSYAAVQTDLGQRFLAIAPYCLLADKTGAPVGIMMKDQMPLDDSWKGSPLQWPLVKADEMKAALEKLERQTADSLLRVKLNFRSPGKSKSRFSRYSSEENEDVTQMDVVGVVLGESSVLVNACLKPKTTARLDRIQIYPAEGPAVKAKYVSALADYGCFLVQPERPLKGALQFTPEKTPAELHQFVDTLMLSVTAEMQGEQRVVYFGNDRIRQLEIGWRQKLFPSVDAEKDLYLFTMKGELAAIPMVMREKPGQDRYSSREDPFTLLVADLRESLADPPKHVDQGNAPLTEADENRLAWMGVELQALDRELARANKVSELSKDGEIGALVSFVYPDSPASKAGIQPGCVLLRLHVQGRPNPMDVKIHDPEDMFGGQGFPWDKLDEVPEQYFDEIPRPWPAAENSFTRALTDFGIGTKYSAELFQGGQVVRKELEIVEGPPHYDSAPRFTHKALGLTVRNMTYEVRRYFQRKPDDPGVIISKVDQGSKASVSGIKPFEMITQVNDSPVATVQDFERLVQGQEEVRLMVKRMTRDRVVKVKLAAAAEKKPAEK